MNKKYQVFISSTYEDLKEERLAVTNTLLEMDCIPAGMEAFCAEDEEQFEVIKKVIDLCDYYILIIGKRYGSINKLKGISYTEMEYDYAVEKGIPVLVFIADKSVQLLEDDNKDLLNKFKEKAYGSRMGAVWKNASDLSKHVAISLNKAFSTHKRPGWTRDNVYDQSEILSQINVLRNEKEKLETKKESFTKQIQKLKEENKQLTEQLNSLQEPPKDIVPLDKLVIKVECEDYFSGRNSFKIKASDIFKYVSVQMVNNVSFKHNFFKEQICKALGVKQEYLTDATLPDKICNYFVSLKLAYIIWNEKKNANFVGLTQKGKNISDELNGFFVEGK